MSLRKDNLVNGEIYHIYNRGVDKRNIFIDNEDRFRFIHDLFEFNDKNPTTNNTLHLKIKNQDGSRGRGPKRKSRELLVEILAFCMMDNHYHLIIRHKTDNGITIFMRKLGTGYTNYFNKKYNRTGALFGGKFKSVCLKKDSHFMYLPFYIHLNPLDLKYPEWKKRKLKNFKEAIKFLDSYRWSSYIDYTGQKNFPSLINKEFILSKVGDEDKFKKEIINWLKGFDESKISVIDLE